MRSNPTAAPQLRLAPALQPGDTIAIISPASPSAEIDMNEGLAYLTRLGLTPKVMPHAQKTQSYLAAEDVERLADLHQAFLDPTVKGILAARGGYGCLRLLPGVDWDLIQAHPKVFIGFSDLTSLLLPTYERTGLVCFHGPMLTSNLIEGDSYTQDLLWSMVMGHITYPYTIPNQTPYQCLSPGIAEGRLMGGNLSLLAALCGTPYQPNFEGAIVFIEDWKERYYSIDRKWTQLQLSGMLKGVRGLLWCDLTDIQNEWPAYTMPMFLSDLTRDLDIPMGLGFSVGHGDHTATLPIGAWARFEATSGHLEIVSAPVAPASSPPTSPG